jgi:Ni/Co efflux regulator RcnB
MKLPNRLIAGLGILMISASPLLQAAPQDQRGGPDDNRQGQQQGPGAQRKGGHDQGKQGQGPSQGNASRPQQQAHQDNRGGNRPPENFDNVRNTIQQHRDVIGRGQPLPPNVHIAKGQPLPRGYGKRLDSRSLQHLPRYDGYEWRRLGSDVVLIAVGSGIVYAILDGVLN